ncbi:RHNO1 protein, partial [Rhynochetos jubatus]|nr:RHNO1 protein [Rhynochetos jubatus]
MPPKKCTRKARKAELVFLESPREGPVHCYEIPLPSAQNPTRVPTKPVDHTTSAAWACPQFETTTSLVLKSCQKKHRGPHKPQEQDANHSLLHAGGTCRRAIPSKFPPLTFENPEGYAVRPSDHLNQSGKNTPYSHGQPKKGAVVKASVQVKGPENCREIRMLPAPQPVETEVFSPPDTEVPQVPSTRSWRCSSALPPRRSPAWHPGKELAFYAEPCGGEESAAVLVTDTPEQEYGVKVTWRQRPHLMKYLRERG